MADTPARTPSLLDSRVLQMEPLTQWWYHEDAVCVALRSVSRIPVVTVGGAFDRRAVQPCRRALEAALRTRPRCVLVDLTATSSNDETGVGLLDGMRRLAAWHGSLLWLAALPDTLRRGLAQTGLIEEFPISRTPVRAIEEIRRTGDRPRYRAAPDTPATGAVHRPAAPYSINSRTA